MGVSMHARAVIVAGAVLAAVTVPGAAALRAPTGGYPGVPPPPDGTVVVYGRGGTFGVSQGVLPSGQPLGFRLVPGWNLTGGVQASKVAVAADGTVLWGGRALDHDVDLPTGAVLAIGAYRPDTNRNTIERLRTTTGRTEVRDRAGRPAAPSITALRPLAGDAMVFTAGTGIFGQDLAANGAWPVLGILSTVDGRWKVTKQWTGRELRDAGGGPGAAACPPRSAAIVDSDCRQFADAVVLPRSGDVIATQQHGTGPDVDPPTPPVVDMAGLRTTPSGNGGMAAIRVSREAATVRTQFTYPDVHIPGLLDGEPLRVIPENISADPTSTPGDERFVVTFRLAVAVGVEVPRFVQEFSYDAATGAIRSTSPPFIPGDRGGAEPKPLYGFSATLYDRHGNLWAGRADAEIGLIGGELAVYTRTGRQRCAASSAPNVTAVEGFFAWGRACAPDYDLRPAVSTLSAHGLIEDPATGAVVALHWAGHVQTYLPTGTGEGMTFLVGNALDLGRKLMVQRDQDVPVGWLGGFDRAGRLWTSAPVLRRGGLDASTDQFLYSFGLADLLDPQPVELPTAAGRSTIVQAERTATTNTRAVRVGPTVEVTSVATTGPCDDLYSKLACGYDSVRGDGYVLRDHTGFGVREGTAVDYRIHVAVAGTYRLSFRVGSLRGTRARITATVAGQSSTTAVQTDGAWLTIEAADPVTLPAGTHTLRLTPPRDGGGWYLNHMIFERE